jgi:hypothetical protein
MTMKLPTRLAQGHLVIGHRLFQPGHEDSRLSDRQSLPRYALLTVNNPHIDPIFGESRNECCREEWWRARQSEENAAGAGARNPPSIATGSPSPTGPNDDAGWKVGDSINNRTAAGKVRSWNTVRSRYWKTEALNNPLNYSQTNLARMQQGLAPQRINPNTGEVESMELHHSPPQRDGGLFDVEAVWPEEHATIDPYRKTGN